MAASAPAIPGFALIGVNPIPSPTDTDALGLVDVGYEYDYNSNAPADVLNPVARGQFVGRVSLPPPQPE
jgi:hypothetical protein